MNVKRFTYRYSEVDGEVYRCEESDGAFVNYSDYAAIEQVAKGQADTILRLHEELAALYSVEARHNALVAENKVLRAENEKLAWGQSNYDDISTRLNALVKAVAWERECEDCLHWIQIQFAEIMYLTGPLCDLDEISDIYDASRAEVDRLIENQGSSDCKGEG